MRVRAAQAGRRVPCASVRLQWQHACESNYEPGHAGFHCATATALFLARVCPVAKLGVVCFEIEKELIISQARTDIQDANLSIANMRGSANVIYMLLSLLQPLS